MKLPSKSSSSSFKWNTIDSIKEKKEEFSSIRYDISIFDDSVSECIGNVSKLRSTYKKR